MALVLVNPYLSHPVHLSVPQTCPAPSCLGPLLREAACAVVDDRPGHLSSALLSQLPWVDQEHPHLSFLPCKVGLHSTTQGAGNPVHGKCGINVGGVTRWSPCSSSPLRQLLVTQRLRSSLPDVTHPNTVIIPQGPHRYCIPVGLILWLRPTREPQGDRDHVSGDSCPRRAIQ